MNGMKHERMRASQRVPFRVGAGAGAAAAAVGREGRSRRGFTMMELITVIAILGIMMAIVFVSVSRIQKDMQQLELDGTAKEIFIAAQNHLATAESQGLIDSKTEFGSHDSRATKSNDEETNNSDDVYYYVVNSASKRYLNSATNDSKTSVLYQMLPFGSIDETVRMGGTYVIQYDRESATVLGVFYANTALGGFPFNRADGFEFQDDDYAQLFPGMTGQAQKSARQDYASASGVTVMVGYYGGEDRESLKGESLNQPRLEILNGDCLVAKIVLPDTSSSFLRDEEPTMKLLVSGDTSGAEKDFTLINKGDYLTATQVDYIQGGEESGDQVFYVYLDDVTWKGGHFSELFDGFIPGENLTLQAVAFSTTRLTNVARSAKGHCNSLFGQLMQSQPASSDDQAEGVAYDKATVASLRHFANMDTDISGYDPDAQEWADKSTAVPKAFDQTVDLSWSTFRDNVVLEPKELFASASLSLGTQSADSLLAQAVAESAEQVRVCAAGEDYVVDEGSFMPVSPSTYSLTYNGGSHRISDVVVKMSSSGDAGLFGALDDDVASDLTLLNFRVSTPNGNAGALAASMSGASRASGVLAYNAADDDREYEVVASGNAGGLVGELHAASMENCAASLYVRSTGASAGGLVGVADNAASVGGSYAGAHTYERAFRETADKEAGHYNVDASGNAGGLVGAALEASIQASYATGSARGAVAGGLVGASAGGSITGSYAVGTVYGTAGDSLLGAFVGFLDGTSLVSATGPVNRYLETTNYGKKVIGNAEAETDANVTSMFPDIETYQTLAAGERYAVPYDATLVFAYAGKYPLPTIVDLLETPADQVASMPVHLSTHFGDWPKAETEVVNIAG